MASYIGLAPQTITGLKKLRIREDPNLETTTELLVKVIRDPWGVVVIFYSIKCTLRLASPGTS